MGNTTFITLTQIQKIDCAKLLTEGQNDVRLTCKCRVLQLVGMHNLVKQNKNYFNQETAWHGCPMTTTTKKKNCSIAAEVINFVQIYGGTQWESIYIHWIKVCYYNLRYLSCTFFGSLLLMVDELKFPLPYFSQGLQK